MLSGRESNLLSPRDDTQGTVFGNRLAAASWRHWFDTRLETDAESAGLCPSLSSQELSLLRAMPPATQELLAARSLLRRTDTKFMFPRHQMEHVLRAMQARFHLVWSGEALVGNYQTRYFDTEDLRFFHEHRRGIRPRKKVRIRTYLERNIGYLEVKSKDKYGVTIKMRQPHTGSDFQLSDNEERFVFDQVSAPLVCRSVQVDFPRLTLVCSDTNERITFDLGLSMRWKGKRIELPDLVVGEVKQDRFRPRSPGMHALLGRKIRPNRMSKYCVAMCILREAIPVHRFRSTLREVMRQHDA